MVQVRAYWVQSPRASEPVVALYSEEPEKTPIYCCWVEVEGLTAVVSGVASVVVPAAASAAASAAA